MRPPAQVLIELLDRLTTLLTAEVNPANQAQHNTEIAKLRDEIAQAKENLAAEDVRMAANGLPWMLKPSEFSQRLSGL